MSASGFPEPAPNSVDLQVSCQITLEGFNFKFYKSDQFPVNRERLTPVYLILVDCV